MALHRSEGTPPRMVNDDRFVLLSSEGQVIFDTDALADVSKSARAYPPGSTPDLKHQPGTYPLVVNERIVGYLWIDRPVLGTIAQLEASFGRSVQLAVWISALLAMVLAFLLAGFLSRRMVEPVLILTKAIRDYARGNYDTRAKVLGKDEIGELARSFNEMAETLTRLEQVRKNLIADVAHELRTPVTLLRGHLEALLETTEEIPREKLALLHDEALRLGHMIQDLQNLSLAEARALPLHPERFSLDTLIEQIVEVFSLTTAEKNIAVQIEIHPRPLLITADRKRLEQVIVNVYGNAIRATPEGGRITITAEPLIDRSSGEEDQAESAETECVKISITDSGPGFREADLPYVFERFYRSDKGRARKDGGTGLGLAIAKSFIEAHGGKIWAENNAQGGARVTFELCANVQTKDIQS
ncbi:MAG: sensor histidine kinase [Candidatus Carbobacillus altaicus]|uniref:histidine kinase n=1 Tax=Candidatus Carbonibacillus altaicus TaxID=2163959 RepID=A0A2R6Y3P4_9BACL|nr:MAG: sensor histidine kinase [Candidatus Carbobacillus altaicus]